MSGSLHSRGEINCVWPRFRLYYGSEFLNEIVIAYCHDHAIEFTRARPYRKNDQAWVEQKNGSVVRRLVGYRRLEGLAAVGVLARLYEAARLFVNFFQPSFKLASKTRVGARVTKRYDLPATPSTRLLASEAVPEEVKDKLRAVASSLDPLRLLDEIRTDAGPPRSDRRRRGPGTACEPRSGAGDVSQQSEDGLAEGRREANPRRAAEVIAGLADPRRSLRAGLAPSSPLAGG